MVEALFRGFAENQGQLQVSYNARSARLNEALQLAAHILPARLGSVEDETRCGSCRRKISETF